MVLQGVAEPLQPMQTFSRIRVLPWQSHDRWIVQGGPSWPDWDNQHAPRHLRNDLPVDTRPRDAAKASEMVDAPLLWGGAMPGHFGHFIADYSTRILQSRAAHPMLKVGFIAPRRTQPAKIAPYLWEILDWLSLAKEDVLLVDRPLRVGTLHVAAQAEQLGGDVAAGIGPSPAYLHLLEQNQKRQGLQPVESDVVYVSRAGLAGTTKGHHAGEGYLVSLLQGLGVQILTPEKVSLRQQLQIYAGARHLIFAEGSALHGRQLLGRVDQTVTVLLRRPNSEVARSAIAARVCAVDYVNVSRVVLAPTLLTGRVTASMGLAIYNESALFDVFAQIGFDLTKSWNKKAYLASRNHDITQWLATVLCTPSVDAAATITALRGRLVDRNLPKLLPLLQQFSR